jgi:hypothetical protein
LLFLQFLTVSLRIFLLIPHPRAEYAIADPAVIFAPSPGLPPSRARAIAQARAVRAREELTERAAALEEWWKKIARVFRFFFFFFFFHFSFFLLSFLLIRSWCFQLVFVYLLLRGKTAEQ